MSQSLLYDSPPLVINPEIASIFGLREAIILQQLHYWLGIKKKKNDQKGFKDGRYWVYNTIEEWQTQFPFISGVTIKRIFKSFKDKKIIISEQFNSAKWDHTNFYTIDYDVLNKHIELAEQAEKTAVEDQNDPISGGGLDQNDPFDLDQKYPSDGIKMIRSLNTETSPETSPETYNNKKGAASNAEHTPTGEEGEGEALRSAPSKKSSVSLYKSTSPGGTIKVQNSDEVQVDNYLSLPIFQTYFGSDVAVAQVFFEDLLVQSKNQITRIIQTISSKYPKEVVFEVMRTLHGKKQQGDIEYYSPKYFYTALEECAMQYNVRVSFKQFCIDFFGAGTDADTIYNFYINLLSTREYKHTKGETITERRKKNVRELTNTYGLNQYLKTVAAYTQEYDQGTLKYEPTLHNFTKFVEFYDKYKTGYGKKTSKKDTKTKKPIEPSEEEERFVVLTPHEKFKAPYPYTSEYWTYLCECGFIFEREHDVCPQCKATVDYQASRIRVSEYIKRLEYLNQNEGKKKDEHGANVQVCRDTGHRSPQQNC